MVRDPDWLGSRKYFVRQDGRATQAGVLTRGALSHDPDETRADEISGDSASCSGNQGW